MKHNFESIQREYNKMKFYQTNMLYNIAKAKYVLANNFLLVN